ncbi:hypothetical protein [Corynebacterium callunae]|uniref:hypothetical protein n=1 Tax=Corynebacterium callunae TaxID=1721 RepID=UPI0004A2E355|nr:hypothetical protein [Corynebacterium callunae]
MKAKNLAVAAAIAVACASVTPMAHAQSRAAQPGTSEPGTSQPGTGGETTPPEKPGTGGSQPGTGGETTPPEKPTEPEEKEPTPVIPAPTPTYPNVDNSDDDGDDDIDSDTPSQPVIIPLPVLPTLPAATPLAEAPNDPSIIPVDSDIQTEVVRTGTVNFVEVTASQTDVAAQQILWNDGTSELSASGTVAGHAIASPVVESRTTATSAQIKVNGATVVDFFVPDAIAGVVETNAAVIDQAVKSVTGELEPAYGRHALQVGNAQVAVGSETITAEV